MRIYIFLNYFLFSLLFLSCIEKKTGKVGDAVFVRTELLDSTLSLYTPRNMSIVDSILIIEDYGNEDIFQVCKANRGSITSLYSFGAKGEGPNEFIFNKPISMNHKNIHIFDVSLQRFYSIECASMQTGHQLFESIKTNRLKNTGSFHNLLQLEENLYFGNGTFHNGMYAFYFKDSVIAANIPFPDDKVKASEEQKGMVYQGHIAKQPGGSKFVFAGYYGSVLEIYNLFPNEKKIERIFSEIREYPQYAPKSDRSILEANFTHTNKIGFFTVSVTHDYIYALYCGKIYDEKRIDFANWIYIYDWNGNLINKCVMDRDVSAICVDNTDEWIYGLHTDEYDDKVKMIGFQLKDLK